MKRGSDKVLSKSTFKCLTEEINMAKEKATNHVNFRDHFLWIIASKIGKIKNNLLLQFKEE